MNRPLFADPKTDFVFKRIFGTEEHKPLLIALLNALLGLDEAHRIADIELLDAGQRIPVSEMKHSIVDVKCRDVHGTTYVVEMQVLKVEAFEKRVVYNVAKGYTTQISKGHEYPDLNDVIGVTICDFELWPKEEVPMLSRWRIREDSKGRHTLSELQFVFLELPKYTAGDNPESIIDKWTYFFREASDLEFVPTVLSQPPFVEALEAARIAGFTLDEWDAYIAEGIAIQNQRGLLTYAEREGRRKGHKAGHREGHREGREEGLEVGERIGTVRGIKAMCRAFAIELTPANHQLLKEGTMEELQQVLDTLSAERRWP